MEDEKAENLAELAAYTSIVTELDRLAAENVQLKRQLEEAHWLNFQLKAELEEARKREESLKAMWLREEE